MGLTGGTEGFTMYTSWQGIMLHTLPNPSTPLQHPPLQVQFSPDGRWILSASFDKSVKLWDGLKGTFIANFRWEDYGGQLVPAPPLCCHPSHVMSLTHYPYLTLISQVSCRPRVPGRMVIRLKDVCKREQGQHPQGGDRCLAEVDVPQ